MRFTFGNCLSVSSTAVLNLIGAMSPGKPAQVLLTTKSIRAVPSAILNDPIANSEALASESKPRALSAAVGPASKAAIAARAGAELVRCASRAPSQDLARFAVEVDLDELTLRRWSTCLRAHFVDADKDRCGHQAAHYRGSANSEPGAVATGSTGLTEQDQCYFLTRQNSIQQ